MALSRVIALMCSGIVLCSGISALADDTQGFEAQAADTQEIETPTDGRGQSIMFQDTVPGLETTKLPIDSINNPDDPCQLLMQQIDALKGKPQQRRAAIQRYQVECRDRLND